MQFAGCKEYLLVLVAVVLVAVVLVAVVLVALVEWRGSKDTEEVFVTLSFRNSHSSRITCTTYVHYYDNSVHVCACVCLCV